MARVYVARHGETTWNIEGRYQGRRDSALSGLGVRQGLALASAFTPARSLLRIVASPLLRCSATARFVADALDLQVEADPRLIEIAHGTWEGRLRDGDRRQRSRARMRPGAKDPGLVAYALFRRGRDARSIVVARWDQFARSFAPHERRLLLVVTHDAIVRAAPSTSTGCPLSDFWNIRVENAAYAIVEVDRPKIGRCWKNPSTPTQPETAPKPPPKRCTCQETHDLVEVAGFYSVDGVGMSRWGSNGAARARARLTAYGGVFSGEAAERVGARGSVSAMSLRPQAGSSKLCRPQLVGASG